MRKHSAVLLRRCMQDEGSVRQQHPHTLLAAAPQVDSSWTWLNQLHKENSTHFVLGREAYLQYVEDAAGAVRRNGLSGLMKFFQGHTA